jgi:hypothetical protein
VLAIGVTLGTSGLSTSPVSSPSVPQDHGGLWQWWSPRLYPTCTVGGGGLALPPERGVGVKGLLLLPQSVLGL